MGASPNQISHQTACLSKQMPCNQSHNNKTRSGGSSLSLCAIVLFCCFVLSISPPSSCSRSYSCRQHPAGCFGGDHCSFPQSLVSIINNRSLFLSLHLPCLLPLHLRLGCTVGSDYCQSIVRGRLGGRDRVRMGENKRERWVIALLPWEWGLPRSLLS